MGYTTFFQGEFKVSSPLNQECMKLLNGLAKTRRMKRDIVKLAEKYNISAADASKKWGPDGELYFDLNEDEIIDKTILEYNQPPSDQPGLWLQWVYNPETQSIKWDKGEKFYNYIKWIQYIITKILEPRNYVLNGTVKWSGANSDDHGKIIISNNIIKIEQEKNYRDSNRNYI